jgi:hypothetical protein
LKYEDLVKNPKPHYMGLMKFLLNKKKIEGTYIEKYIDLAFSDKPREIYKPRKAAINGNKDMYP